MTSSKKREKRSRVIKESREVDILVVGVMVEL